MTRSEAARRVAVVALAGLAVLAAGSAAYHWLTRPPQMGYSPEAFRTVDALYTAVRNRDAARLGECERRLRSHRDAGRLSAPAGAALDAVIRQARSGAWDAAARRLYRFMRAQRRG